MASDEAVLSRANPGVDADALAAVFRRHPDVRMARVAEGDEPDRYVAHIDLFPAPAAIEVARAEIVAEWARIFDQGYRQDGGGASNFRGWTSSFTSVAIPEADMRSWRRATTERILSLRPRRLLEVGCGLGLILEEVAPSCEAYLATDVSPQALADVRAWTAGNPAYAALTLAPCEAREISRLPDRYDTIVLNSVIQYFPDVEYLTSTLAAALDRLEGPGQVFLGDVRHLGLLDAFHAAVQYAKATDETPLDDLRWRAVQARTRERELAVDPGFFRDLPATFPQISAVEILLKPGAASELTRYRYDVILHVGRRPADSVAAQAEWTGGAEGVEALLARVRQGEAIWLTNLLNARLEADQALIAALARRDAGTVRDLRTELAEHPKRGVMPEMFWAAADVHGVSADISWSLNDPVRFDVRLQPSRDWALADAAGPGVGVTPVGRTNSPIDAGFRRQVEGDLHRRLADAFGSGKPQVRFIFEPQETAGVGPVSPEERHRLLVEWNATSVETPPGLAHELFSAAAARTPEAVALVFEGETVTYGELEARANRLARRLRALGVGPDVPVALCVERSVEMVVGLLAVLKAGGAYVPLDPAYPAERLGYMLADTAAPVVLTHAAAEGALQAALAGLTASPARIDLVADAGDWANLSEAPLDPVARPEDLAYIIYTSGSTGAPKGVMVEHAQLCTTLNGAQILLGLGGGDVFPNLASFAFDISLLELLLPLTQGAATVVTPREHVQVIDELVARTRDATCFHAVPSLMEVWSRRLGDEADAIYPNLRTLLVGGEPVPQRLLDRLFAQFPKARVLELYGPTEGTIICTAYDGRAASAAVGHCIGRPMANVRIYLLDAAMEPVPVGVAGELYIGGAGVARGYLNRPELTAERFVESPFVAGDRLYRTGDLARYRPDGEIEFLGRNDFQVKVRGFRIELGEVEARLTQHPAVQDAVVLAREDQPGDIRLVAYLVASAGAVPQAEDLRAHVLAALPEHMAPAAYVRLDAFPLTPNGKLDRKALPALEAAGQLRNAFEAPRPGLEAQIAAIWQELLDAPTVGRHDSFVDLGGHSLIAVQVLEHMRRAGLEIEPGALFEAPRLADVAAAVRGLDPDSVAPPNRIPADCPRITPDMLPLVDLTQAEIDGIAEATPGGAPNIQDIYPLAPLQEGMLFHHLLVSDGDPYIYWGVHAFTSRSRLDAFVAALRTVVERHDVWRTAVLWEGLREPVQVVLRDAPLRVEEVRLDPAEGEALEQLRARFSPRRFRLDVRVAPMMRLFIARDDAQDRWIAVELSHHLACDHTAQELMQSEIEALMSGRGGDLKPPLPFRNFVAQSRFGAGASKHEAFFRDMLHDVDESTAPFGVFDVQGDGDNVAEAHADLPAATAQGLRRMAKRHGVSPASLFHVAWGLVLSKTSTGRDAVFGTVLFGRMRGGEGADRVLGLFMNTLPIRVRLGALGVAEAARDTHGRLAELLGHEHAPLALAQRCSGVGPQTPLFTTLLNYRRIGAAGVFKPAPAALSGMIRISEQERTNYPLTLDVDDLGEGFRLNVLARAPIEADRVCAMMEQALAALAEALDVEAQQVVPVKAETADGCL